MAYKIGIVGDVNTGKSYSRKFIKNGEEVFVVAPSQKMLHLTDSKGKPLQRLKTKDDGTYVSGNFMVNKDLNNLPKILNYVNNLSHIKVLILPDFTHFISAVLSDKTFIKRKSGGEAFQRLN